MEFLSQISYTELMIVAVPLALAPFYPEPHLVEKLRMLKNRELKKPLDIFDLLLHSSPAFLIAAKFIMENLRAA